MKFSTYLNESFEDKIFILIDKFMQERTIKSGKYLLELEPWKNLITYLVDEFEVASIRILPSKNDRLSGDSGPEGITINVPDGPITDKLKVDVLGVLFHEMAHQMQTKENSSFLYGYVIPSDPRNLIDFANYFLQRVERPSQAISLAITLVSHDIDIFDDLQAIKNGASNAKSFAEINSIIRSIQNKYNFEKYVMSVLHTVFIICGFVYSLHLQQVQPALKKETDKVKKNLMNKWSRFEKNFRNSYRKFRGYFKRYNMV